MKRVVSAILIIASLLATIFGLNQATYAGRPARATAQATDALLQMLPDFDGVIVINGGQLNTQFQALLAERADLVAKTQTYLSEITAKTGIDLNSVQQVVIGFSLAEDLKPSEYAIILSGAFDQDQILARLSLDSGKSWKAKEYNGQMIYTEPAREGQTKQEKQRRRSLSFFDNQSILAFGPRLSIKRVIDTHAGIQANITLNSELMGALSRSNGNASIRFAFKVPEKIRQRLATATGSAAILKPFSAVTEVRGSADLSSNGFAANISLITGSSREAIEVVALINMGITLLKFSLIGKPNSDLLNEILNGINALQSGSAGNVTVNIPAEVIKRLIEEYRKRLPGQSAANRYSRPRSL